MGFTRRSLLKRSSIALAASSLPPWLSGPLLAQVANPLVRHDVNGTNADAKAAVAAYRKGVGVMKLRKSHDPTSWLFQANIHAWPGKFGATASDPEQEFKDVFSPQNTQGLSAAEKARREQLARAVWGTCTHGDPAERFLPWHRVYLFFFERLIHAAAGLDGSSSAGLPYWNWTKDRTLPLPLREAVNGSQDNNSLYWNNRRVPVTRINNPESIAADSVAVSAILDLPDFSPTFDPNADLGFSNQLEQGPHGDVHVWIQTPPRGMGFFEEAARDPAFWLHHANLDRLWAHWRKNAAHKDPVDAQVDANTKWGDLPQTFVDIDGQPKTLTAKQVLIAAQILDQGYVYDDLPAQPPVPGPVAQAQGQGPAAGPGPSSGAAQPARVIASTGPVTISARTKVDLKATASGPGPNAALATTAVPNVLVLKQIVASAQTPSPSYGVYLNLPENVEPDPQGPYFAGRINTFTAQAAGHVPSGSPGSGQTQHSGSGGLDRRIAVGEVLRHQQQSGLWQGGDVAVVIVPMPVEGQAALAPGPGPSVDSGLKVGSMELIGR